MSNQQSQIDPETMSMEELAAMANEEMQQPRDEQGRFVAQEANEPAAEEANEEPAEEITVYRRTIDLGDGSGVQVFEGESEEELIEKLVTAQAHATRKIREQAAQLQTQRQPQQVQEPAEDPNEEFVLGQQFIQSPTKAFAALFKKQTGMTIEEFNAEQAKNKAAREYNEGLSTGQEYVKTHPDYYPTPKNGAKIEKWLKNEGLSATLENIDKAVKDLGESGLLEAKSATSDANQDAENTNRSASQPRIAATTQRVVGQRRAASGLSSKTSSAGTRSQGPTEADLDKMSYEELAQLANQEMRAQQG